MSELKGTNSPNGIHWQLLASVSAAAVLISVSAAHDASASDDNTSRPTVWIELGGELSRLTSEQDSFLPPFVSSTPRPPFEAISPQSAEKAAPASWDGSAKITLEPVGSDWMFSAAVVYGKSGRSRYLDQHTQNPDTATGVLVAYQSITSRNTEGHTILDFRAGRDVGLGMGVRSTINVGVRYVHFTASSDSLIQSEPANVGFPLAYHQFNAHLIADRKFNGVGPSLSWDASAAIVGNRDDGEIAADWGVDGAVLFGRQSILGDHQSTDVLYSNFYTKGTIRDSVPLNRRKEVTVPNLGGFAGVAWRYPNAKVVLGYRADFFFGAMDSGIDARETRTVGFYGPFATISIGLGG